MVKHRPGDERYDAMRTAYEALYRTHGTLRQEHTQLLTKYDIAINTLAESRQEANALRNSRGERAA